MKIHLLWATVRPYTFIHTYNLWKSKAKNEGNFTTYVAVNYKTDADILESLLREGDKMLVVGDKRKGVCYPSYMLSSQLEGDINDIVIFASDDFVPPQNWDEYLINKLKDREGALMVRDGYQLPDSSNMKHPCITIPIMTFGCLEKMNKVIYHPDYFHLHSDAELYENLKELDLLIDERMVDTTVFEHFHWAAGKRNADQNDQNYNSKWNEDGLTMDKRMKMTIQERLMVNIDELKIFGLGATFSGVKNLKV